MPKRALLLMSLPRLALRDRRRLGVGLRGVVLLGGLLLGPLLLTGCGEDRPATPAAPQGQQRPCQLQTADAVDALGAVAVPVQADVYGQEIWISWMDTQHKFGFRYPRTRKQALYLAQQSCEQCAAGADIGAIARKVSNAPGGRAEGFCKLPVSPAAPDLRDRALLLTPVGAQTPLIEWRGGFWFARRIDAVIGSQLEKRFRYVIQQRARARVIVLHHDGAYPKRVRDKPYTQAQAVGHARGILRALQEGGDFDTLASKYSHDQKSGSRGGLLHATHPRAGESRDWIRWGDRGYPQRLLDLILEGGVVGSVHPEPLITERGVMLVEVLDRRP